MTLCSVFDADQAPVRLIWLPWALRRTSRPLTTVRHPLLTRKFPARRVRLELGRKEPAKLAGAIWEHAETARSIEVLR